MQNIDLCSVAQIHPTWKDFFSKLIVAKIEEIGNKIGNNYNPAPHEVLRFSSVDISSVKVVIIGQDPYPQKGIPSGRAFEVRGLSSWGEPFPQASLKNIIRNIYRTYNKSLLKFASIREEMQNGNFPILDPSDLFNHWEKEGVLLLNTYYTCEVGKPQSHRDIWGNFGKDVVEYLSRKNPDICWFLWGNEAHQFAPIIGDSQVYMCNHPASRVNIDNFLECSCFEYGRNQLGIKWMNPNQ